MRARMVAALVLLSEGRKHLLAVIVNWIGLLVLSSMIGFVAAAFCQCAAAWLSRVAIKCSLLRGSQAHSVHRRVAPAEP